MSTDQLPEWLLEMPLVTQDRFMAWVGRTPDPTSPHYQPVCIAKGCTQPAWVTLNNAGPYCIECATGRSA